MECGFSAVLTKVDPQRGRTRGHQAWESRVPAEALKSLVDLRLTWESDGEDERRHELSGLFVFCPRPDLEQTRIVVDT